MKSKSATKKLKENRMLAERIYDCLVEAGAFFYHDLSDEAFAAKIREQYAFVAAAYHGRVDLV